MKVLCVGGGTLGSVTPLLAVVEQLKLRQPSIRVEWWGTETGPERELIEAQGISFKVISGGKLRRYLSLENFFDLARILSGFMESLWRFGQSKPDCLLTAGSYVAVPVGWAAYFYGVPVFIHQQDVKLGLANRLLKPVAKVITVALSESVKDFPGGKVVVTGNPVRSVFEQVPDKETARKKLGLDPARATILIIGGGTGAQVINELVANIKQGLVNIAQVIHLTGPNKKYEEVDLPGYLAISSTNESVTVLVAADLVITRAGMGVLTELSALSKPAVVVPIPDSHQQDNADYFAKRGGVILIPQEELTPGRLLATVSELLGDNEQRNNLGKQLKQLLPPGAAGRVADLVTAEIYKNHEQI
ncbi:MAG TPA: hypothetical protein DIS54_00185 [Candidatus Veblenbacteria bacterium]|nr:hypothetical protein [Candidatus Veblenbacteria bacterium]